MLDDEDNRTFTPAFKKILAEDIQSAFGLVILGNAEQDSNRGTAFLQSRAFLIRKDAARYVEQFEGLYAMMRGLGCVFFLSAAYLLGWVLSFHWKVTCLGLLMLPT